MTFFIVLFWLFTVAFGDSASFTFDPVNTWAAALMLAVGFDLLITKKED